MGPGTSALSHRAGKKHLNADGFPDKPGRRSLWSHLRVYGKITLHGPQKAARKCDQTSASASGGGSSTLGGASLGRESLPGGGAQSGRGSFSKEGRMWGQLPTND